MHKDTKMQPIFVFGRHRSGTTWVTNVLMSHKKVFSPNHEIHNGQHESAFFCSLVPYFNDCDSDEDLIALKSVFEKTDFWDLMYPKERPQLNILEMGYIEYFRKAYEVACDNNGCDYWVEKTPAHTLWIDDIIKGYPDAKFIFVRRNTEDVVKSNVYQFGDENSPLSWLKNLLWCEVYNVVSEVHKDKLYFIQYELLISDYTSEINALLKYLNLSYDKLPMSPFKSNSSFAGDQKKIKWGYKVMIYVTHLLFVIMPNGFVCKFVSIWKRKRKKVLPKWLFKMQGYNGVC